MSRRRVGRVDMNNSSSFLQTLLLCDDWASHPAALSILKILATLPIRSYLPPPTPGAITNYDVAVRGVVKVTFNYCEIDLFEGECGVYIQTRKTRRRCG